ncbi:MAG: sulfite exporter TauE/SafE family protein [Candidatus Nanohaloarchaea archaeon]
MALELYSLTVMLVLVTAFIGGFVKGFAGFGYAIAGTALLAAYLEPSLAVAVMIFPVLAVNFSLTRELDSRELKRCMDSFWQYLLAAFLGTLAGLYYLEALPSSLIRTGIGLLALGYVFYRIGPSWSRLERFCFRTNLGIKTGMGLVSGLVFGATNIGVPVVAYFDSIGVDRKTFVGMLAAVFVGLSAVRFIAAWFLELYSFQGMAVSVVAALPALAGVWLGEHGRVHASDRQKELAVLTLLFLVGLKLVL